jgi:hypothetical protein
MINNRIASRDWKEEILLNSLGVRLTNDQKTRLEKLKVMKMLRGI